MRKNNTAIIFGSLFFSCSVMAANGTLAPTVVPMVNGGQASIAISNTSPNLFTVPGDTPLDDKEKGFISSTTIPVFKYLVDPQMLGVSNSMIYQLTDYIGYDILLQYIQELIQQARAMVATGNYDEAVIGHINDNMNDATRQIAAFQSQVQVQQDALLVVDRQMSYMRQQLSARMLSRYQNNYHFGGSTL